MRHYIIVVGGHINDIFAKEFIEKERPELCIAADSGMNFFYRNKLTPDWIIGDFDSASSEALDCGREKQNPHDHGRNHAREGKTVWKVCVSDPLYECSKRSYADRFQVSSGSL